MAYYSYLSSIINHCAERTFLSLPLFPKPPEYGISICWSHCWLPGSRGGWRHSSLRTHTCSISWIGAQHKLVLLFLSFTTLASRGPDMGCPCGIFKGLRLHQLGFGGSCICIWKGCHCGHTLKASRREYWGLRLRSIHLQCLTLSTIHLGLQIESHGLHSLLRARIKNQARPLWSFQMTGYWGGFRGFWWLWSMLWLNAGVRLLIPWLIGDKQGEIWREEWGSWSWWRVRQAQLFRGCGK